MGEQHIWDRQRDSRSVRGSENKKTKKNHKKPTVPVLNIDVLVVFRIGGRVLAKLNVLWKLLSFLH